MLMFFSRFCRKDFILVTHIEVLPISAAILNVNLYIQGPPGCGTDMTSNKNIISHYDYTEGYSATQGKAHKIKHIQLAHKQSHRLCLLPEVNRASFSSLA